MSLFKYILLIFMFCFSSFAFSEESSEPPVEEAAAVEEPAAPVAEPVEEAEETPAE